MDGDHHKGLRPCCLYVQEAAEAEREDGWVLLSRGVEVEDGEEAAGETLSVT